MVTIPAQIRVRGRFAAPLAARAKPPDSAGVRETPGGAGPGPPEGCRYEFKFDSELTTCQSKQISVADAARSPRRLSLTAQSSVPLGRSLEAALRRSPSKHISVADAAGTPLARRAQSHCGSYETEILIGAGRDWLGFLIFFPVYSMLTFPVAYAVFVEFCSETQCQAITALFLVQISCSWRRATFDSTNFDRGAALEFTNS